MVSEAQTRSSATRSVRYNPGLPRNINGAETVDVDQLDEQITANELATSFDGGGVAVLPQTISNFRTSDSASRNSGELLGGSSE
jgi:hypothetical protein